MRDRSGMSSFEEIEAEWDVVPWSEEAATLLTGKMVADVGRRAGHADVTDEFKALMAAVDAALATRNLARVWQACVAVERYAAELAAANPRRRRFRRRR